MPGTFRVLLPDNAPFTDHVSPGMTYELPFERPGQQDWRLWDFRCDVRIKTEAADSDADPLFSLNSDDDEITVDQTDDEIAAAGDQWQLITLRMSSAKTLLLVELEVYKFDVWAFLKTDPDIRTVAFPYSELFCLERVTHVA